MLTSKILRRDCDTSRSKQTGCCPWEGDGAVAAPDWSVWKEKLICWKLPYYAVLSVRHYLDPMHITKNVCNNMLNTLMNMGDSEGFTSHTPGHATLGNQEGAASRGA